MLAWKLKITTHEPSVPAAFLETWTAVHEITDLFIFSFSEKLFYRFFFSKQRINVVLREADWERSVLLLSSQLRNRLFHALVVIPMAERLLFNDFIVTDVEQFVISFCRQPNRAYRTQHKYSFALEKLKESLKVIVYSHKLYCAKEFPHALAFSFWLLCQRLPDTVLAWAEGHFQQTVCTWSLWLGCCDSLASENEAGHI